jgi:hypothetical protein
MSITPSAVVATAKLYEARRLLKRLLGDQYDAVIGPVREALARLAPNGDILGAMTRVIEDAQADGVSGEAQLQIIAAAVDLIEGSEETTQGETERS